jgi:8-oxo-dGTP pyrophosphatase MutT (NUDIX family)
MSSEFEEVGSETIHEGHVFSVRQARFRHADGEEVTRDLVEHGGAVGVVAHDGEQLFLVRQPREAVGRPDLLELPAGRLDVDGEPPEDTARRELAEEIGKEPGRLEHLTTYFSSAGFTNEVVHVYLATELRDVPRPETGEDERIDVVTWPIDDLDGLIDRVEDAKTLVGLLLLRRARG